MKMATGLLVLLCVTASSLAELSDISSTLQCRTNSDCGPGRCCMMTQNRYSLPTCQALGDEGATCRPGEPIVFDGKLSYPNGFAVVHGIHQDVCPCAEGLDCSRADGGQCRQA